MRIYPCDSPQAAARIVALTVLADRDIGKTELNLLDHLGACRAWGASAANRPQRSISHRLFAP